MKLFPAAHPTPRSALTLAALTALTTLTALTAGCSSINSMFSGDTVDYRSTAAKTAPLEVPPDLTQLSRDNRYQQQGGVVSAAASPTAGRQTVVAPSAAAVAPLARGDMRIERDGPQRWLVVPVPPEKLWPQLQAFWAERGFTIDTENAETGVMETNWAENRAKLPQDGVRKMLGRVLGGLYDSGERDRFRTRVERTASGSEVYISHRGMIEVYTDARKEVATWTQRPSDPQLEAEFLSRLMVKLAPGETQAAAAATVASAPLAPPRARALAGAGPALEIDEPFDRAWRRVGQALDRSGFTVEDRDRAGGLYFVRYVDPKNAGKEEPGFFSRMFSGGKPAPNPLERYRIAVKSDGGKTTVSVLTASGSPETGATGERIAATLINELR